MSDAPNIILQSSKCSPIKQNKPSRSSCLPHMCFPMFWLHRPCRLDTGGWKDIWNASMSRMYELLNVVTVSDFEEYRFTEVRRESTGRRHCCCRRINEKIDFIIHIHLNDNNAMTCWFKSTVNNDHVYLREILEMWKYIRWGPHRSFVRS